MQASDDITHRTTFVILHKTDFPYLGAELPFRKGFHEISPLVSEHLRLEDHDILYICLDNLHTDYTCLKQSNKYSLI